jgi:hypothetical protein
MIMRRCISNIFHICSSVPGPGGPQDGLSGQQQHPLPGGPQDGLSGRSTNQTGSPEGLSVANDADQDMPNTSDDEQLEESAEMDIDELDFLCEDDLAEIAVELMDGDKQGSQWLVMEDIYICHR